MLVLVTNIYLVYEQKVIVIVHSNLMWPTINEPSRRSSYVKCFGAGRAAPRVLHQVHVGLHQHPPRQADI
jgi:hypothetical protein